MCYLMRLSFALPHFTPPRPLLIHSWIMASLPISLITWPNPLQISPSPLPFPLLDPLHLLGQRLPHAQTRLTPLSLQPSLLLGRPCRNQLLTNPGSYSPFTGLQPACPYPASVSHFLTYSLSSSHSQPSRPGYLQPTGGL